MISFCEFFPKILLMTQQFIQGISYNLRETDCKKSSGWLFFSWKHRFENIGVFGFTNKSYEKK